MRLSTIWQAIFLASAIDVAAGSWATLPSSATIPVEEIQVTIPPESLRSLQEDLSPVREFPLTYENTQTDLRYGVNASWVAQSTAYWRESFDWPKFQERMNKHPSFFANLTTPAGDSMGVHFMGLFSQKADAIPVAFFHGWPGAFLEFIDLLDVIKSQFNASSSPYHIIVPSLPGFTLSSAPSPESNWGTANTSALMDDLLSGLGFKSGYIAQGGDIGSFVARTLALTSESCKGIHLNMIPSIKPDSAPPVSNDSTITPQDREVLARSKEFFETQQAYAILQGTKPSTLGFALHNNPVGLLAWTGEKFMAWTDPSHPLGLDHILQFVSMYHLTQTISRSFYSYRETSNTITPIFTPAPYISKPMGYSRFPYDNTGVPERWARDLGNLTFYRAHSEGGHFPALERPEQLWEDVTNFIKGAFPQGHF
ncbi:unnamed protein product [Clonostachys byssicola]|uniref:Epoxide hydrolase N-terminal domain-containing protein n=1 Tax=Clonostachys byssicola TaxID=160290 RepID=A0A9N9XY70_9HYPO|nr:unnamed protein product [Clonostachys byssicola]